MNANKQNYAARLARSIWVCASLLVSMFWCFGGSSPPQIPQGTPPPDTPDRMHDVAEQLAAKQLLPNFAPSLEARESTDFLLTPALLMQQEAISDRTSLTYPEE
jgi:hypothetical protein